MRGQLAKTTIRLLPTLERCAMLDESAFMLSLFSNDTLVSGTSKPDTRHQFDGKSP
jgi:hypothetical protein